MELASFRLGFSHAAPKVCAMHTHDCFATEIVYYENGAGEVHALPPGETDPTHADVFLFQKASVLIHPPLAPHDQRNRVPGRDHCLHLDTRALPEHPAGTLFIPRLTDARLRQEILTLTRIRTCAAPARQRVCDLRVTALFCELCALARTARSPTLRAADRLEEARLYLHENFDVIGNLSEVAQQFSFSPDYFRHLFARAYGQPPKDYLLQLRLEHARTLLRQTPLPQKEIAALCGFGNIRYFNTRFRHYLGVSPGQLRKGLAAAEKPSALSRPLV